MNIRTALTNVVNHVTQAPHSTSNEEVRMRQEQTSTATELFCRVFDQGGRVNFELKLPANPGNSEYLRRRIPVNWAYNITGGLRLGRGEMPLSVNGSDQMDSLANALTFDINRQLLEADLGVPPGWDQLPIEAVELLKRLAQGVPAPA